MKNFQDFHKANKNYLDNSGRIIAIIFISLFLTSGALHFAMLLGGIIASITHFVLYPYLWFRMENKKAKIAIEERRHRETVKALNMDNGVSYTPEENFKSYLESLGFRVQCDDNINYYVEVVDGDESKNLYLSEYDTPLLQLELLNTLNGRADKEESVIDLKKMGLGHILDSLF